MTLKLLIAPIITIGLFSLFNRQISLTVVAALLNLFRFSALYIADLDAIQGRGDHRGVKQDRKPDGQPIAGP